MGASIRTNTFCRSCPCPLAPVGLADPAPVLQTFFVDEELKEAYQLDAVITVVDAKHIVMHLDEQRPEGVENESGDSSEESTCFCAGAATHMTSS